MTPERRAHLVKIRALELGFDSAGITDLGSTPHASQLRQWLAAGMAGTMHYMHRQATRRLEPATIVSGSTRAVVVTRYYFRPDPHPPLGASAGRIAKYARGRDYHEALREPLERLASYVRSLGETDTITKYYVDAGPVPERELAQRAGLGWIGKNTMLIDPRRGSFCFLATLFTNLDLALDRPFEADRCGSCRRCLDACPTHAFPEERVLDSRLCISYLTIEHTGSIVADLGGQMGDWVFGCDICQDVCPWNQKFARPAQDAALELDPSRAYEDLAALAEISDDQFRQRFGGTPLERPGAEGMRRNARIATENLRRESRA